MANVKKPAYYTLYSLTCKINNKMYIGVCRWYGCLKDAAIDVNMNYDTVRARINGYNKQKINLKWL